MEWRRFVTYLWNDPPLVYCQYIGSVFCCALFASAIVSNVCRCWCKHCLQSFKRRYFYLKQQADASFVLEFHKDEKRMEAKGAIFLDSAVDVRKVSI